MRRSTVRALVLRVTGTNCAAETAAACQAAGMRVDTVRLTRLAERPRTLRAYHLLVLPGGFSHGDYLGAGTLMAAEMDAWMGDEVRQFVASGRLVLGICNGFQVLTRLGLLPDVALAPNERGHFECRWTYLSAPPASRCVFTRGLERLSLPVAHGEGRVIPRTPTALATLAANGQIALRYTNPAAQTAAGYPWNPNGSSDDVAGVCNEQGTVFGLMPHPERATTPYHLPGGSHAAGPGQPLGGRIFANALAYLAGDSTGGGQ